MEVTVRRLRWPPSSCRCVSESKKGSEGLRWAAAEVESSSNVRFSEGWPVWSHCPNSKVGGQENSIEFPLDSCPDFILLYMVYVHYWLSGLFYDLSSNPILSSHHWFPKCRESKPTSSNKGPLALLHPNLSPCHCLLLLQFWGSLSLLNIDCRVLK